jgi:hypothetical protein
MGRIRIPNSLVRIHSTGDLTGLAFLPSQRPSYPLKKHPLAVLISPGVVVSSRKIKVLVSGCDCRPSPWRLSQSDSNKTCVEQIVLDFQLFRYTVHTSPCFYECGSNNSVVLSRAATNLLCKFSSVEDSDPGSGAFLTPGSGIRNRSFPDPVSRIPHLKLIFLRAK